MSRTEIPEDKKINLMLVVPMLHQGGFERVCVKTARLLAPLYNVTIAVFDLSDAAFDLEGLHVEELGIGAADSIQLRLHRKSYEQPCPRGGQACHRNPQLYGPR